MGWRFDAGRLEPGASIRWAFWWGGDPHEYQGVQVVQARALPIRMGGGTVIAPSELRISEPAVRMDLDGGYTYSVTVTNVGPFSANYELVGNRVD